MSYKWAPGVSGSSHWVTRDQTNTLQREHETPPFFPSTPETKRCQLRALMLRQRGSPKATSCQHRPPRVCLRSNYLCETFLMLMSKLGGTCVCKTRRRAAFFPPLPGKIEWRMQCRRRRRLRVIRKGTFWRIRRKSPFPLVMPRLYRRERNKGDSFHIKTRHETCFFP